MIIGITGDHSYQELCMVHIKTYQVPGTSVYISVFTNNIYLVLLSIWPPVIVVSQIPGTYFLVSSVLRPRHG